MAKTETKAPKRDSFEETARRLECDDDKERFEQRLGKLAKAKPEPKPKKAPH